MSVAKVIELSATSNSSFDDAVQQGVSKATQTLRNIKSVWVSEMHADVENGKVSRYRVTMRVTFLLDD